MSSQQYNLFTSGWQAQNFPDQQFVGSPSSLASAGGPIIITLPKDVKVERINFGEDGKVFDPSDGFYCYLSILHQTSRAWLLRYRRETPVWFPKSASHVMENDGKNWCRMWIASSMAKAKGLDWEL